MTQAPREAWTPPEMFGDRIRRIRRSVGLSQADFANAIGEGSKALATWEAGTREPRSVVALAKRIELAFNVPAAWVLGLDGSVLPPTPPAAPPSDGSIVSKYVALRAA